ncbi:hypothetical protein [Gemmata sp.]|uniref:hypothetical protein n=1 Tax=Gemmata sp. TaxID=1914242 RepID=UPI003F72232B
MLKEALQYMNELGRSSASSIVETSREPHHVYFIRRNNGELEKVTADEKPEQHTALSLQAVTDKAIEYAPDAEVWYSPTEIVAVVGKDHPGTVKLALVASDQYKRLADLKAQKPAMTQMDLIRDLRTTFRDSLALCGDLVESLRKVNFRATATTQGEVGHGKASLGKEITGEVTGLKAIPEYVTFEFPAYANPSFRSVWCRVECALEPDPTNGCFRLLPLPGQLEVAAENALSFLADELKKELADSKVRLFFGKP